MAAALRAHRRPLGVELDELEELDDPRDPASSPRPRPGCSTATASSPSSGPRRCSEASAAASAAPASTSSSAGRLAPARALRAPGAPPGSWRPGPRRAAAPASRAAPRWTSSGCSAASCAICSIASANAVERLLRLGLGRLDHQRLRRRAAGSRSSAGGSRSPSAAWRRPARFTPCSRLSVRADSTNSCLQMPVEGQVVGVLQPRQQVVRVQHRGLGGVADARRRRARGCRCRRAPARRSCRRSDFSLPIESGRSSSSHERAVVAPRAAPAPAGTARAPRSPPPARRPGPPPPCGVENDLWVLKWTMSKPMSPGRDTPITAFRFAPS